MIVCSYNNVIAVAVQLWPFLGLINLCAYAEATITSSSIETRASWKEHLPLEVEEHKLAGIAGLGDVARFNETLSHILVPRVVGTTGHAAVNQCIQEKMRSLNWHVSTDRFDAVTPNLGNLVFENIIATLNPSAERFVILACHYDSKYFKDNVFLGASDSAVPCAMLIDLAETLDNHLKSVRDQNQLSMQLVFFDGEEAFREWTATDSLYGSRHLAQRWQNESRLEQIDMLILLDLLGMPDPQFFSFFANTEQWHGRLVDIEQRLTYLDLMVRDGHSGVLPQHANAYFKQQSFIDAQIDDDHMPFLQRGVPILHLIPVPFPDEWHKFSDNWHAIDFVTVENLCRILRVFVIEYLNIKL